MLQTHSSRWLLWKGSKLRHKSLGHESEKFCEEEGLSAAGREEEGLSVAGREEERLSVAGKEEEGLSTAGREEEEEGGGNVCMTAAVAG